MSFLKKTKFLFNQLIIVENFIQSIEFLFNNLKKENMKFIIKYDEQNLNWSCIEAAFIRIKAFLFCFLFEGKYIIEIVHPDSHRFGSFDEYLSESIRVI